MAISYIEFDTAMKTARANRVINPCLAAQQHTYEVEGVTFIFNSLGNDYGTVSCLFQTSKAYQNFKSYAAKMEISGQTLKSLEELVFIVLRLQGVELPNDIENRTNAIIFQSYLDLMSENFKELLPTVVNFGDDYFNEKFEELIKKSTLPSVFPPTFVQYVMSISKDTDTMVITFYADTVKVTYKLRADMTSIRWEEKQLEYIITPNATYIATPEGCVFPGDGRTQVLKNATKRILELLNYMNYMD